MLSTPTIPPMARLGSRDQWPASSKSGQLHQNLWINHQQHGFIRISWAYYAYLCIYIYNQPQTYGCVWKWGIPCILATFNWENNDQLRDLRYPIFRQTHVNWTVASCRCSLKPSRWHKRCLTVIEMMVITTFQVLYESVQRVGRQVGCPSHKMSRLLATVPGPIF